MSKPILNIVAGLNKKATADLIQKNLDQISKNLKLTIGVDKSGLETIKKVGEEQKKQFNAEQQREKALQYEQKVRYALEKKYEADFAKLLKEEERQQKAILAVKEKQALTSQKQASIKSQVESKLLKESVLERESLKKQEQKLAIMKQQAMLQIKTLSSNKNAKFSDSSKLSEISSGIKGLSVSDDGINKMKMYNQQLREVAVNTSIARQKSKTFGDEIKHNLSKFASYYTLGGAFIGTISAISSAISTVYELDNALNQIRIVTGKTQEEVVGLTKEYNEFAMANSVTTVEVAKLSTELYRQGLAQDEVADRMQAIIKYSKISGLSVEEAGEIITASANGTKKDVNEIIDVFANLGDMTAAGADEIGMAMQRVAGSAETAGIPFEQLAGQIATVASITRESASTIGNSFKSILARYGSIKATGFNEEDATNINEVTKALSTVGIVATDTEGKLRPFGEVIDELGVKWVTLDSNTQKYLATTLGG